MGIIGLVLGIVGLLASLAGAIWPIGNLVTFIGLGLAVVGIVLSALDMKKSEKHGKAVAGLVLSIIAIVIGVVMLLACGGFKNTANKAFNEIKDTASQYSAEELQNMSPEEQQSIAEGIVNDMASDLQDMGIEVSSNTGNVQVEVNDEAGEALSNEAADIATDAIDTSVPEK